MSDIKWELNEVDDKAEPPPAEVQVVQGTASEIKLVLKKPQGNTQKKSTIVATQIDTTVINMEKPKPKPQAPRRRMQKPTHYLSGVPRSFLVNRLDQGQQSPGPNDPLPISSNQSPWAVSKFAPQFMEQQGFNLDCNVPMVAQEQSQYSPTKAYDDENREEEHEGSSSPDPLSQKRLSAFQILGPLSQPKKPKLTINLLCDKDQSVREVVGAKTVEEEDKYTPVHLRKDIKESTDEIIVKYLPLWPWKKPISVRKVVTARNSKSVMLLEQEQMEEIYEKDTIYLLVTVFGYPATWTKEDVLDALLDNLRGKTFIPCFIEFKPDECKFLVVKCRSALLAIHKMGFYFRKDDVELCVKIGQSDLSTKHIDFIPRLVLRKCLALCYDGERILNLKKFTITNELSHFIYFPLNRLTNQTELVQMQSTVAWNYLTDLDLSHNRIVSIDGLDLPITAPRLKHLDLSYNCIEKVSVLLPCRDLLLHSLKLEGNPVCRDYLDATQYVKVVKMIFTGLIELDGVPIHLKGTLPLFKRNYCPYSAVDVVNNFLEVYFPLLESPQDDRGQIETIYDEKAVLTITYKNSLRYSYLHRKFRNIFIRARNLEEDDESTEGASAISKVISKWPDMVHDPYSFTVDVLHHDETATLIRIGGLVKLSSGNSLAEDDQLVAFMRTVLLVTESGVEYKIKYEMLYWDEPTEEQANKAFRINVTKNPLGPSLKLDSPPSREIKAKLLKVFMTITGFGEKVGERCLELKEWDLKTALEYFMKLLKLDNLDSLFENKDENV